MTFLQIRGLAVDRFKKAINLPLLVIQQLSYQNFYSTFLGRRERVWYAKRTLLWKCWKLWMTPNVSSNKTCSYSFICPWLRFLTSLSKYYNIDSGHWHRMSVDTTQTCTYTHTHTWTQYLIKYTSRQKIS